MAGKAVKRFHVNTLIQLRSLSSIPPCLKTAHEPFDFFTCSRLDQKCAAYRDGITWSQINITRTLVCFYSSKDEGMKCAGGPYTNRLPFQEWSEICVDDDNISQELPWWTSSAIFHSHCVCFFFGDLTRSQSSLLPGSLASGPQDLNVQPWAWEVVQLPFTRRQTRHSGWLVEVQAKLLKAVIV